MKVSAALSLVSRPLPLPPPGRRSRDEPAGGASPGAPSTNSEEAVPHESASMTSPPMTRTTIDPPAALSPPLYVWSAHIRVGAIRVGDKHSFARRQLAIYPAMLARHGGSGRGGIDELDVGQESSLVAAVEDLDVLVRSSRPAGDHFAHHQTVRRRPTHRSERIAGCGQRHDRYCRQGRKPEPGHREPPMAGGPCGAVSAVVVTS